MTISFIIGSVSVLALSYFVVYFTPNTQTILKDIMSTTNSDDQTIMDGLVQELWHNPIDPNSFSRPDLCRVTHIRWTAVVNFDDQTIDATVDLTVEKQSAAVDEVLLDTSGLTVSDVRDANTDRPLAYVLSPSVPRFGAKLTVKLPQNMQSVIVRIAYRTSPEASALQWLKPEQTAGKRQPYMLSQCQAIHCRSVIPCQDTPSVKASYEASVVVPKDLVVVMSAVREGQGVDRQSGDKTTKEYHFRQKIAIPSYLIAIAVGDLVSKQIGPRSHVWSEPELIDQSAYEFANTEKYLATAEEIVGDYVWGVYDLLVLPPSFAYGGMENPCLTFVTPTLLAGDRSLDSVVAHEIAHSWTGNLVTNKNWGHFWLNEGFTRFLEMKIVGRISGGEPSRQFAASLGLKKLKDDIDAIGVNSPLTKLLIDHRGVDPDDAFSGVPYEKGHTFLFYLEQLLGGPAVFEPFLKKYIDNFKYKSIETKDFRLFFETYFVDKSAILKQIDWELWINSTGMPPVIPDYDQTLAKVCTALAQRWIRTADTDLAQFKTTDIAVMNTWQTVEFLMQLRDANNFSIAKLEALTEVYGFRANNNTEIRCQWLQLCLKIRWKGCTGDAIKFVTSQGRMKFLKPIYRELYAWDDTRQLAIDTYNGNRNQLMHMSALAIAKELHLNV